MFPLLPFEAFRLYFVSADKEFKTIGFQKALCYIRAVGDSTSTLAQATSRCISWVTPKQFAHNSFVRHFYFNTVSLPDLIESDFIGE